MNSEPNDYFYESEYPCRDFIFVPPEKGGCTLALIGASRSGKTTLMKTLYQEFFRKYITIMFSFNLHADIYKDMGKKVIVSEEYRPELIKDTHYINQETKNKFNFLYIFDDIIGSKIKNDQQIVRLLTVERNCDQSSIFSVQDPVLMNRVGRGNVNYVMLFKQNSDTETEQVIKAYLRSYLPSKMTMNEKIKLYNFLTRAHHFIFIDNLNNRVYRTKVRLPGQEDPVERSKTLIRMYHKILTEKQSRLSNSGEKSQEEQK